ncbi:MAG: ATPase [Clostridiaceae bacterium]|jgi:transcriptional regulator NrdR family protein|nr:ATPase [Clostridiaceae bacterium]
MKVIKRDGRLQDFDINKVLLTVEYASDSAGAPMASSDIKKVGQVVEEKINSYNTDPIHSSVIQQLVIESLKELGFSTVAKHYSEYR